MKKTEIIKNAIENGAIEENGVLTITKKKAIDLMWNVNPEIETNISGNVLTMKHKNLVINVEIVSKKSTTKESGGHGHKTRNDGYVVEIKMKSKKMETITNMKTCAEIKMFIKELNKKECEMLHIYDTMKNECRKSAWIDKIPDEK